MARGWTNEQIEWLKKHYGKVPTSECEKVLGKTKHCIREYAMKHGISSHRYFTDKEKIFIKKMVYKMAYEDIDRKLGRPLGATRRYCYNNGMLKHELDDCLSLSEASRLTGLDKSTINRTWAKYGLKITKSGKYSFIKLDHFLDFMENHPERYDATKCERWYFQNYKWFEEKRKEDFDKMVKKRWGNVS